MSRDRRIDQVTGNSGEWFVYLKPGFTLDGAHCFGEDEWADVAPTMARVRRCGCPECRRGRARHREAVEARAH